jgi:RimJ/RimL family protein N-acetyltransferase
LRRNGRRCPRVESYIVELEAQPIGYIQYHLEGPGQAGLDMMLLPAFRDRGLGPRAARVMVAHLQQAFGWTDITVDPAQDNPRAIRAWAKAGFVIEREWPDHPDGPAVLMRLAPDAATTRAPGAGPSHRTRRGAPHPNGRATMRRWILP